MTLNEQLAELKAQNVAKHPKEIVNLLQEDMKKMNESGIVDNAPKTGERMKNFTLSGPLGKPRSLAELRKKGPVVVTFYRGGWCPYCSLELRAYQAILKDIKDAGATLVAITPELPDASLSTTEKHKLEFEVLTDVNSEYAREIGLVFTLPEHLRPVYADLGIELEKHNGAGQFDLPLAGTFVVDTDGTIACADVDADYTKRAEPSDVVAVLNSLKTKKERT
nr:peroxiredoxin-like family protein [uncultured Desulfobacter sp.]